MSGYDTLLAALAARDYRFVTPTPATHARVIARADRREARDLQGIFGWSLPFNPTLLDANLLAAMAKDNLLEPHGSGRMKSRVRVSSIGDTLFVHSAFPTESEDAVFFGPDSYRFVDFVAAELAPRAQVQHVVDIGAGSGVGGIMAATLLPGARVTLADINAKALAMAEANARQAGVAVELVEGAGLDAVEGSVDLVLANPPYIIDDDGRIYRDGGDMHGARISLDWALAAAQRLDPGGTMLLYTGSAIVEGRDALREALERELPALGCTLRYRELDPDVFGEELKKPAYRDVERIAAVGAVLRKS